MNTLYAISISFDLITLSLSLCFLLCLCVCSSFGWGVIRLPSFFFSSKISILEAFGFPTSISVDNCIEALPFV